MLWVFIFIVLNCVNSMLLTTAGYGVSDIEYWLGLICCCGCYFVGGMRSITK